MRPNTAPRSAISDPVVDEILQRLAVVEGRLALLEQQRRRHDPADNDRLLAALAAAIGSAAFSVADVLRLAALNSEIALALNTTDGRRVGARLRQIHRRGSDLYQLTRIKRDNSGAVWCISASTYTA